MPLPLFDRRGFLTWTSAGLGAIVSDAAKNGFHFTRDELVSFIAGPDAAAQPHHP